MDPQPPRNETVHLDHEAFYDSQDQRITEDYLAAAVAEAESDEVQLDEAQAVFPHPDAHRTGGAGWQA